MPTKNSTFFSTAVYLSSFADFMDENRELWMFRSTEFWFMSNLLIENHAGGNLVQIRPKDDLSTFLLAINVTNFRKTAHSSSASWSTFK